MIIVVTDVTMIARGHSYNDNRGNPYNNNSGHPCSNATPMINIYLGISY